jgi:DnaK suppressor protein
MAVDVEKYRKPLLEELDRMKLDIQTVAEQTRPATDDRVLNSSHVGDTSGTAGIAAQIIDLRDKRRGQVLVALQKIDDGTYGTCENCGREINPKRLDADSAAVYCIDCASKLEGDIETPTL